MRASANIELSTGPWRDKIMRILSSIKSLVPPRATTRDAQTQTHETSLFDVPNAIRTITDTVHDFVIKRRSESSEQLRALITQSGNGELVDKAVGYKAGDILVVSTGTFNRIEGISQPHGMIVHVTSTEPFECELLEMVNGGRNRTSTQIGQPIQMTSPNSNMYFMVSGEVDCARVKRYIDRSMCSGGLFRVFVGFHEACTAFIDVVGKLEGQRQRLSKHADSTAPAFYGVAKCNNLVFDTVKRALEIRDTNNVGGE